MTFQKPKPYNVFCTVTTRQLPKPSTFRVGAANTIKEARELCEEDAKGFGQIDEVYAFTGIGGTYKSMTREYRIFKAEWTEVTP